MSDETYLLFAPKSARGLKVDYPELSEFEEFKSLRAWELLFVWYYACKSSPYFNLDWKERDVIKKCTEAAKYRFDDEAKKEKFMSGNFPAKIETAIKQMQLFEPDARIQAKLLAQKMIEDIKKMTSLELDERGAHPNFMNKDGDDLDIGKQQKYMDMLLKAQDKLGDMIAKAERGWGVTKKNKTAIDKNKEDSGDTFAESFHNDN